MKFTINNVSEEDIHLTLVSGMPGFAKIDLPKVIEAGKSASGEIVLMADVLGKEFEKSFTFECDDQAKSRFTVPVKRTIRGPNAAESSTSTKEAGGH